MENIALTNKIKISLKVTAVAASILISTGCSLTRPYVVDANFSEKSDYICQQPETDMSKAMQCGDKIKKIYIDSVNDQAALVTYTGMGLITMTTLTLGFTVHDASSTKITDWVLAGTGLYSLSYWLSSEGRDNIYIAGQKAIQCAENAIMPFMLDYSTKRKIEADLKRNEQAYALVASTSIKLEGIASLGQNSLSTITKNEISTLVNKVQTIISNSRKIRSQASLLLNQVHLAPRTYVATVKEINSKVNSALSGTIQSVASLPGVVRGIGSLYSANQQQFAGYSPSNVGELTPTTPQLNEKIGESIQALESQSEKIQNDLNSAIQGLLNANASLNSLVTQYKPNPVDLGLEECGIDEEELKFPITTNPMSLNLTTQSEQASFTINGGNGFYAVEADKSLFAITQTPTFGSNVTVTYKGDKGGTFQLNVTDTTGKKTTVTVIVTAISD